MNQQQPTSSAPIWGSGPASPYPGQPPTTNPADEETTQEQHAVTSSDLDRLREDIAHTRQELGDTIEALSARMDVKARARQGLQRAKGRAAELAAPVRVPSPAAGAVMGAGVAAGVMLVVLLAQRRRQPPQRSRPRGRRR